MLKKRIDQISGGAIWASVTLVTILLFLGIYLFLGNIGEKFDREMTARDQERASQFKSLNERRLDRIKNVIPDQKSAEPLSVEQIAAVNSNVYWNYDGLKGPSEWASLTPDYVICEKGKRQSPIDLVDASPTPTLPSIIFKYQTREHSVVNDGRSILINVPEKSDYITYLRTKYFLTKISFHTPSEHYVDGAPYDMEIQFHHLGPKDTPLNLSVFMEALSGTNKLIDKLWRDMPTDLRDKGASVRFNPQDLLPIKRRYYTYEGSLTTPPCSEGVLWIAMVEPIGFSIKQLDQFREVIKQNSRPLQNMYGKKLRISRAY